VGKQFAKAVVRATALLRELARENGRDAIGLARATALPRSTVYVLLATLESEKLVSRDPKTGGYYLGLGLFELGHSARMAITVRKLAVAHLKSLQERWNETISLSILDSHEVLYLEAFESTKRLRPYSVVGVRAPAYCSAVGKALLAFSDEGTVEEYLSAVRLERFTEKTIGDAKCFREELARVRLRGYAVDDTEHEPDVRCVGAPVIGPQGRVVAGISLTGPSHRITTEIIPEIAATVKDAAAAISRALAEQA
jgi:DNA-binding IclR family transcriptional regulator